MKINVGAVGLKQGQEVRVGNLYPGKGGKGETAYWLIVALTQHGCVCLGLNAEGEVVNCSKYYRSAMKERALLGFVPGIADMSFDLGEE